MATKQTIKNIIAAIKHIYPYYAKDTDITYTISIWEMLLSDYDDDGLTASVHRGQSDLL